MKRFLCYSIIFLALAYACTPDLEVEPEEKPDPEPQPVVGLPEVKTNYVTDLSIFAGTISGSIVDPGLSEIKEVGLIIDISPDPDIENNLNSYTLQPDSTGFFSIRVMFTPATTIYVKAYAINEQGIGYGNQVSFTTDAEKIYHGRVELSTQEEVEEFGSYDYNVVEGGLIINDFVDDLSPLKSLVIVTGEVHITTSMLKDLRGLENLRYISRDFLNGFRIQGNLFLESLEGLNNLELVNGQTEIYDNDLLTTLSGLEKLRTIYGGSLAIANCDKLESLNGLESLFHIGNELYLSNNPLLSDLSALKNLNYIYTDLRIINNPSLENLYGLEKITRLGVLTIDGNNSLVDLEGISNLDTVGAINIRLNEQLVDLTPFSDIKTVEYLSIENNNSLIDLSGFEGLESVSRKLLIMENSSLESLRGLENIESLGGFGISYNDKLENLTGLEGLTTITNDTYGFTISANPLMSTLTGLDNLIQAEGQIAIAANESLGDFCALKNFFTNGSFGDVIIEQNLTNPTPDEIVENCL